MNISIPKNIIISRTDSIGDVILTIPVAAVLKNHFPEIKIGFLGKAYTKPVIEACKNIDFFIDINDFLGKGNFVLPNGEKPEAILHVLPVEQIAKRAKQLHIPLRIGTTNRWYHWFTCNKLVKLSRKKSSLHEAQLNLKLLSALGIEKDFTLGEIEKLFDLDKLEPLEPRFEKLIDLHKYNLIFHPKSQGSAREWGLENFVQLAGALDKNSFNIFVSGTSKETASIQPFLERLGDRVTDITGMMELSQFMSFIKKCDGLVANSTGPLHIAAALGKAAFGIYPPMRPIHPGRWAPIGAKAQFFVLDKFCEDCKGNKKPCACILAIKPAEIKAAIEKDASL
jgi:heptosyltransferase III